MGKANDYRRGRNVELEKKVVLVVDDAPSNIRIVNEILHKTYTVKIATNGVKALELASTPPAPDLILLDVVMPGMDGYEVCVHLKSDLATKEIPVIFLTGQTEITEETRGFEAGAVDYIHKPFSPAVVAARVHTHLALRETRQKLAKQLRAIQSELETARLIQLSILPSEIPIMADLDIAARYFPMSAVAGDFYDFLIIDEKRIGILVADVSGHGMPAALIASMLKIAFAAEAPNACDPARVLSGLNQTLCGKFQGHYVTAVYALIDTATRTLRYAGAGHPPLLLRGRDSGDTCALLENGLFLGYFPDATYAAAEIAFQEGDWLALYTDGISEAMDSSGEQFGEERLRHFLGNFRAGSSAGFADALLSELSLWAGRKVGHEPDDDATLVAVHFRGAERDAKEEELYLAASAG
jgi:serine phosphatase RsbU (regulator of sigma subunit)